ncbi:iron chelate uptake ABC transporter family permease subunit [Corynebacterium sp. NPDC060344]|uniref:iron chelate uptake ABC transporter family permease subunit n=1 Tax=Corynebacterium sp. NPDC060344 TaxID=3347101 RepID=UPI00365B56BE
MSTAIDRSTPDLPEEAFAEFSEVAGIDEFDTADAAPERSADGAGPGRRPGTGPLPTARSRKRYWIIFAVLAAMAIGFATANLAWGNPMPFGSRGFWLIAEMRVSNLAVMLVVAFCQATATVAFQTVTHNRILTPSIMGFESLYVVIQTAAVFFIGAAGVAAITGTPQFLGQVAVMVVFSAILYGWLFGGRFGNLQIMLLVGIILGGGMGALSTFMQRMLTPSEFDVLTARLIGSVANADTSYLLVSLPIIAFAGGVLWLRSTKLNVLGLGRDTATNLGVNHKKDTIIVLIMVSMLMAVSTALVGPMTFLGFLVAMIAYQLADTYDHRHVFPIAWLTGFVVLSGSYFALKNFFYAEGSVGIIIEVVGGSFFLIYILRKGRL